MFAKVSTDTRFLEVEGGRVAYDDQGAGPLVVCMPSLGDVRAEYRFLRPQLLAAGFRVVTMDLRGQGESSTTFTDYSSPAAGRDLLALLRHLDAGPAAVVATSMAAGSAAWAAAQEPASVQRLVLIGPFVRDHGSDRVLRLLLGVLLSRPWGAAFWTWYFPKFYPSARPADFDGYRSHLRANLNEPGRLEALRAMMNRSDRVIEAALARVAAPTLVVMGSRDPDFPKPAEEAAWIAERLKGTVLMLEGAGHYPQAEVPDQAGPAIVDFLEGGAAGAA